MFEYFDGKDYPGRGIMIGLSDSGTHVVIAYFIMGRSENSRNRKFDLEGEKNLIIHPVNAEKVTDPSLIIYRPLVDLGNTVVVTNGDQTDTIVTCLNEGGDFETALSIREYEPDAPNFTPRISGILQIKKDAPCTYKLSILKKNSKISDECDRLFYEYEAEAGKAHLIHTYRGSEDGVLLSFDGAPIELNIGDDNIQKFSDDLYKAIDGENLISLFVRFIDVKTSEISTKIINKMEE